MCIWAELFRKVKNKYKVHVLRSDGQCRSKVLFSFNITKSCTHSPIFGDENAGHLFGEENDGTLGLIPSYTHLTLEEQNIDAICL